MFPQAYRDIDKIYEQALLVSNYTDDAIALAEKFEKAKFITPLISNEEGYVEKLDAKIVGQVCLDLGAGRKTKEDRIDNAVGITLVKKIGDEVNVGDILAYIHASTAEDAENGVENLQKAYKIATKKIKKTSVILDIV